MIPKPRTNLLVYHGAFAPNARGRREAVGRAQAGAAPSAITAPAAVGRTGAGHVGGSLDRPRAPAPTPPSADRSGQPSTSSGSAAPRYTRPRYYPWADLLRRTFAIDVLACPGCGGRLRLLATIVDPPVVAKILHYLGLPAEVPAPAPPRQLAW
jgi:hypothetical protein